MLRVIAVKRTDTTQLKSDLWGYYSAADLRGRLQSGFSQLSEFATINGASTGATCRCGSVHPCEKFARLKKMSASAFDRTDRPVTLQALEPN